LTEGFGLLPDKLGRMKAGMNTSLVMTIIGQDRPGLVESVARLVTEHGGNWLESRMSRLGGQFAGILRVEAPTSGQAALIEALNGLKARGLAVVVHPDATGGEGERPQPRLMSLELVGQDRPGIVRQIAAAFAGHEVNVEELNTACESAPMSGEVLFKAQAKLHVPASCNLAQLRQDLEKIAADLIVEITLEEPKAK
jgi:glycine cleavage system regulatory protein